MKSGDVSSSPGSASDFLFELQTLPSYHPLVYFNTFFSKFRSPNYGQCLRTLSKRSWHWKGFPGQHGAHEWLAAVLYRGTAERWTREGAPGSVATESRVSMTAPKAGSSPAHMCPGVFISPPSMALGLSQVLMNTRQSERRPKGSFQFLWGRRIRKGAGVERGDSWRPECRAIS